MRSESWTDWPGVGPGSRKGFTDLLVLGGLVRTSGVVVAGTTALKRGLAALRQALSA